MDMPMRYPQSPELERLLHSIRDYSNLKYEYGATSEGIQAILDGLRRDMGKALDAMLALPDDEGLAGREPDDLDRIRALRPRAPRRLWDRFDAKAYAERLAGAFLGRMAGCTLGAPVEFWNVGDMRDWAAWTGDAFPPTDYWSAMKNPNAFRYQASRYVDYTRGKMDGVPVDDDITYTMLGLLIAEDYGLDFTIEDAGRAWVKYLPYACTAEDIALRNLNAGVSALRSAELNNPYVQWIGADIRSDPWGYIAPGLPEKAAEMAWKDAWLSHRRNGIYGEMYFSAVISAAFAVDDPIDALRIGLDYIPADCLLANDIRWALESGKDISGYVSAREAVERRFGGMSGVHTNLNACLTIFGLMIGGGDFTRCIGETVAMGYDNDCTAATAGSIFGAAKGMSGVPEHWYARFNNKVLTYINGHPRFDIDDVFRRFAALAEKAFQ